MKHPGDHDYDPDRDRPDPSDADFRRNPYWPYRDAQTFYRKAYLNEPIDRPDADRPVWRRTRRITRAEAIRLAARIQEEAEEGRREAAEQEALEALRMEEDEQELARKHVRSETALLRDSCRKDRP